MDRGYGNNVDYEAYGYDPQYYQNVPQTYYQQPYMYHGNPYMGQQFMSWNPGTGPQYHFSPPSFQQPCYPGPDVNYGSYNSNGCDENQVQTGDNGSVQVRKYSYSQNRNRNRQRPDTRSKQSGSNDMDHSLRFPNESKNNKETENAFDKENSKLPSGHNDTRINHSRNTQRDFDQFRSFDKNARSHQPDRKFSNKYANQSHENSRTDKKNENGRIEVNNDTGKDGASNTSSRSVADARVNRPAKSYSNQRYKDDVGKSGKHFSKSQQLTNRPALASADNSDKSNENDSYNGSRPKKYEKYSKESQKDFIGVQQPDGAMNISDSFNGAKKKKKETFIFSSSGHRDGRNINQDLNRQQKLQNRFNYRGMDYNKRHKEELGLERGSDRTKLSENAEMNNDGENFENEGKNDENFQRKNQNSDRKTKGTRMQRQITVDESQRGVLIDQLTKGSYECMVCFDSVRAQNAVWSCSNCHHVFHLRCIKRWAKSPNSVVSGGEKNGWRCPACQNLTFKFPNQYRCFCGKVKDPEITRTDTPHSCGDVCRKNRGEGCKHPCTILCHPGPCPECNAVITKSCDCGKTKQTVRCGQSTTIKCESDCEKLLNCGKHFCTSPCHSGPCVKCDKVLQQECYGEHETREVVCGSEESFTESYSCKKVCGRILDCGNHTCESLCHRGDCPSCPGLPANMTHCPCGSTSLKELDAPQRTNCSDPVPTCENICNKVLTCGPPEKKHRCKMTCHEGPCGPCDGETMLTCRCLFMDKKFKCSEITQSTDENGRFICDRRCNKKKACGRHRCALTCCIKEEHPCDMVCGKKLPCGLHKCEEPCHRTNCPPCLMASFDELTCYCGAEVLYPPIPCGTPPPECHRPCTRQHSCNHPVRHNCHSEDKCPLCTELTKKWCMGGHEERTNIPCHLQDISCGMKCGKPLPCGEHVCQRLCHKGDCMEEGQKCTQPCPRKRDACDHICALPCHGEEPCPPSLCKAQITIKCACGHRESQAQCSFDETAESAEYQKITIQSLKESLLGGSSVSIGKFSQGKLGSKRMLECNEECALIERNRRVALALEIQNPDLTGKLGNPSYTDFLKEYAKNNGQFVAGIEKALSELVQTAKQSKQTSRSHAFPSMNNNQRRVVHELAEFYGCETQSYDYEPNKNVVATAKRNICWLPSVTLTSLVQRELHPRAPPPIPHFHKEEVLRQSNQALKQSTTVLKDSAHNSAMSDGWHVIGKKTKKSTAGPKSAIATIDRFEENLSKVCSSGKVNYDSLSNESKQALKAEPVVDYFDFTVN